MLKHYQISITHSLLASTHIIYFRRDCWCERVNGPGNTAVIDQAFVSKLVKNIDVSKFPSPDEIYGKSLRFCAEQLSGICQHLFQTHDLTKFTVSLLKENKSGSLSMPALSQQFGHSQLQHLYRKER